MRDDFWVFRQGKKVHIESPVGQAQFMLTGYLSMARKCPREWMLLCRFADTIGIDSGRLELRELRRLAEHLKRNAVELRRGNVDPVVAIEVEKELVLRTAPDYAEGMGHDITPAARMLKDYEQKAPVFTQAERNLVLRYAYFFGDPPGTEQLARAFAAHNISDRDIAAVCADIETIDLEWSGLEKIEGIEVFAADVPTFRFSSENCEDPMKVYPRFAFYPGVPNGALLLHSGAILKACPEYKNRRQSDLLNIDQTYGTPRYYIHTGYGRYEIAERIEITQDLAKVPDSKNMLPPEKTSVRERLRNAIEEVNRQASGHSHNRGGKAR